VTVVKTIASFCKRLDSESNVKFYTVT
jgi:hypothetical protein